MTPVQAIILADFLLGLINRLIQNIQESDQMTEEQKQEAMAKLTVDLKTSHDAVQALQGA